MWSRRFDSSVLRDASWWQWAVTVPLLAAHLAGVPWALAAATALCLAMAAWYLALVRAIKPFPVQIRLAFTVLLLAGLAPGLWWIHWVQLVGTCAMVTVGYCLLGRMLMLAPWNRSSPLSLTLVGNVIVREPTGGGLLAARSEAPNLARCSLAGR
jgi:hypothetical protein